MPLVPFHELMTAAETGGYAVGYFESWDLGSLLAVADAAEATRSPVILGFSGMYLTHPQRAVNDPIGVYAAMGLETSRRRSVPSCLLFNESPVLERVLESVDLGFNLVMFADENLATEVLAERVVQVVAKAHPRGVAVEAEMMSLFNVTRDIEQATADAHLDDPATARQFVEQTGVDALAVSVGQVHVHGRNQVRLNLEHLKRLRAEVPVPLVLHGATSVYPPDLAEAIRLGVRKINVGSVLKRTYFEALRNATNSVGDSYNPYDVVGSGCDGDVLTVARLAMQARVEEMMHLFGSAGRA